MTTKYSKLTKYTRAHDSQEEIDLYTEEEQEAELVLDQLKWDCFSGTHEDLQNVLSKQSNTLDNEIIDFLLQWEHMDEKKSDMKDTHEVLNALKEVDNELLSVDMWLGNQIEKLYVVHKNLHMIEGESGDLESTWKNLNDVQEIISLIMNGYSISPQYEELLTNPLKILQPLLKSNSLLSIDSQISPLHEGLMQLYNAINLKLDDLTKNCSTNQWKSLKKIQPISTQRAKLLDISSKFCSKFMEFSLVLFDWILKHKSVVDGIGKNEPSITIKNFQFSIIYENYLERSAASSISVTAGTTSVTGTAKNQNEDNDEFLHTRSTIHNIKFRKENVFLSAQLVYQNVVLKFMSLMDIFFKLAPNYEKTVRDAYLKATTEKLYTPIIKLLSKECTAIVCHKHGMVNLASISKYRINTKLDLPLKYAYMSSSTISNGNNNMDHAIYSWVAFRMMLLIICPVLEQEENFLKRNFNMNLETYLRQVEVDTANGASGSATFIIAGSPMLEAMDTLFSTLIPRMSHCFLPPSSGTSTFNDQIDGIEAIAMLTTLTQFAVLYNTATSSSLLTRYQVNSSSTTAYPSAVGSTKSVTSPIIRSNVSNNRFSMNSNQSDNSEIQRNFSTVQIFEDSTIFYVNHFCEQLRRIIIQRINAFTIEQVNWLTAQKGDFKSPNVLTPFAKLPSLILQIIEMCNGLSFECVDDLIHKLCKELFNWLTWFAKQSEKYNDKVKFVNYEFFVQSVSPLRIPLLENYLVFATQQKRDSRLKYVNWMVSYEFPELSALAFRMDGVGTKVNSDELSLYIRRKDVLNVIKELDMKTLDTNILNMRKRLDKHLKSDYDQELLLVSTTWMKIKERVMNILTRLEDTANASYQIQLDVTPTVVFELFNKYSTV